MMEGVVDAGETFRAEKLNREINLDPSPPLHSHPLPVSRLSRSLCSLASISAVSSTVVEYHY